MPLVSIITPSHNSGKYIQDTINSVIAQKYRNWEMIIVDDCSIDNSVEIITNIIKDDWRIKLISLNKNVGAASARNIALTHATGRFIAFLDSDDVWSHDKLEKQVSFMLKNDFAFTFTAYDQMSEEGIKLNKLISVPKSITYDQYLKNTIIGCLTVIIDKEKTGDFIMPLIKSSHDMALWLLIMKRGFKAYGLNEPLATYRLVSNSNTAKKWKAARDVWKVYREIENINIIKSSYYFICYTINAIKKRI